MLGHKLIEPLQRFGNPILFQREVRDPQNCLALPFDGHSLRYIVGVSRDGLLRAAQLLQQTSL